MCALLFQSIAEVMSKRANNTAPPVDQKETKISKKKGQPSAAKGEPQKVKENKNGEICIKAHLY